MVELLSTPKFMVSFGRAMLMRMDISGYYGNEYECSCGNSHTIDAFSYILCQGYWRVMVVCPEDENYITSVKVRMFLMAKFLGFRSLNGVYMQTHEERVLLASWLARLR